MRAWSVTIRETLDDGKHLGHTKTVEAATLADALAAAQDKHIDAQPEHAHRYEITGVALTYESPKEDAEA